MARTTLLRRTADRARPSPPAETTHGSAPTAVPVTPNATRRRARRGRVVGLEIADTMLRGVSVPSRGIGRGTVHHAEIGLPEGAVRHGDVVDHAAVVSALRQLWKLGGFPTKRVILGLGSSDVVTRQLELPDLNDRDLRAALRFEIADMIPFPVSESMVDVSRIETVTDERDVTHSRVLAIAALRSPLQALAVLARAAGLKPVAIDLTPYALIRAAGASANPGQTEAIVHLGDFSISVVVHRDGVPRFTRSLATSAAGSGISRELEAELGLIERYLQRTSGVDERIGDAAWDPVVSAIRGTLDYYAIQEGATPISRVTLTGHNAWAAAIAPSVVSVLGVPVGLADPLNAAAPYQESPFISPVGTSSYVAALGLATSPGGDVVGPDVVGLLPGKDSPTGRRAYLARVLASVVVTAGLLGGVSALAGPDTAAAAREASAAEASLRTTRAQLSELAPELEAAQETAALERRQGSVAELVIDWQRLLGAVRTAFPDQSLLLSLTARGPTRRGSDATPGSIKITGQSLRQATISALLERLGEIPGIANPWLTSARTGKQGSDSGIITFAIEMKLDERAMVVGQ